MTTINMQLSITRLLPIITTKHTKRTMKAIITKHRITTKWLTDMHYMHMSIMNMQLRLTLRLIHTITQSTLITTNITGKNKLRWFLKTSKIKIQVDDRGFFNLIHFCKPMTEMNLYNCGIKQFHSQPSCTVAPTQTKK
jgi:hypothetical protein